MGEWVPPLYVPRSPPTSRAHWSSKTIYLTEDRQKRLRSQRRDGLSNATRLSPEDRPTPSPFLYSFTGGLHERRPFSPNAFLNKKRDCTTQLGCRAVHGDKT